jgi:NAD(P)-dependent dehydrogenase (short-subunit alcohol dehydrogenase family)
MGRLAGKMVVITGGGEGIGRGIALRFAGEGARIVIAELREDRGARTVELVEARGAEPVFVQTNVGSRLRRKPRCSGRSIASDASTS